MCGDVLFGCTAAQVAHCSEIFPKQAQAQCAVRALAGIHAATWRWPLLEDMAQRTLTRASVISKASRASARIGEDELDLDVSVCDLSYPLTQPNQRSGIVACWTSSGERKPRSSVRNSARAWSCSQSLSCSRCPSHDNSCSYIQNALNSFCVLFAPPGSGRSSKIPEVALYPEEIGVGITYREGRDFIELAGVPQAALEVASSLRSKVLELLLLSRRRCGSLIHSELRLDNILFYSPT